MHLSNESLIVILVVGIVAGWLAGQIVRGGGFGLIGDLLVGIIGAFIIGPLMDRFGPYRVMSSLFVMGALFSIFLGLSLSWTAAVLIAAASFGSGFCTSGVQKGGNALSIFFYPTALRSTGLGWGLGIGRIGAIVGPLAVGYLLTSGWSSAAVFCAMAVPMLVGATAILAMGRVYGIGPLEERFVHTEGSAGDARAAPSKA